MFVIQGRYNTFFVGYSYDDETGESFQVWDIDKAKFFSTKDEADAQIKKLNDKVDGPFYVKEFYLK